MYIIIIGSKYNLQTGQYFDTQWGHKWQYAVSKVFCYLISGNESYNLNRELESIKPQIKGLTYIVIVSKW